MDEVKCKRVLSYQHWIRPGFNQMLGSIDRPTKSYKDFSKHCALEIQSLVLELAFLYNFTYYVIEAVF